MTQSIALYEGYIGVLKICPRYKATSTSTVYPIKELELPQADYFVSLSIWAHNLYCDLPLFSRVKSPYFWSSQNFARVSGLFIINLLLKKNSWEGQ